MVVMEKARLVRDYVGFVIKIALQFDDHLKKDNRVVCFGAFLFQTARDLYPTRKLLSTFLLDQCEQIRRVGRSPTLEVEFHFLTEEGA